MEENLKIKNSLTPLSPTQRVSSVGNRQSGRQQNSFKQTFQKKQKKKGDKGPHIGRSSRLHRRSAIPSNPRKSISLKNAGKTSRKPTIDITV
jgi:hypothetical protein